ncbi:hypothetical protein ACNS7O_16575 (plasmid) [Haloferacaceae archaeon DSL9]
MTPLQTTHVLITDNAVLETGAYNDLLEDAIVAAAELSESISIRLEPTYFKTGDADLLSDLENRFAMRPDGNDGVYEGLLTAGSMTN